MSYLRILYIAHPYVLLAARIVLGITAVNAAAKTLGAEKERSAVAHSFSSRLLAVGEILGAIGVLAGIFTQFFAFFFALIAGGRAIHAAARTRSAEATLPYVLIALLAALIATGGGGKYALDAILLI